MACDHEKEVFAVLEQGSCAHSTPKQQISNDQGPGCNPGEHLQLQGM